MTMTRKLAFAAVLAAVFALALPMVAFGNFAIHGNYVADTDACAGCHRAHTSVSTITWNNGTEERSALLVSSATQMYQFCYACHDATGQGADTNVQEGIYEGTDYGVQGGTLNGGGAEFMPVYNASLGTTVSAPVTSEHEFRGSSWGAFGGGYYGGANPPATLPDGQISGAQAGESVDIRMDCATCHDVHGSANYRILKAQVNGNNVGGYVGTGSDPDPDGWVSSVEQGWPEGGFRLHLPYDGIQPPTGVAYKPDYTTPRYAKGRNTSDGRDAFETGMSGWCAGCHQTYLLPEQTFTKTVNGVDVDYVASGNVYNAGDGSGLKLRHRHPINVPLSKFNGAMDLVVDSGLPLAHDLGETAAAPESSDWIECLTCHRAHGTVAQMEGFAADGSLPVDVDGVPRNNFVGDPSALLRMDNRGVCEACHNK